MCVRRELRSESPGLTLATNSSMRNGAPGDQEYGYLAGIVSPDPAALVDMLFETKWMKGQ